MPILSDHDLAQMRSQVSKCPDCLAQVLKNYCRQCDEFFTYNHEKNCPRREDAVIGKHKGHRTY